MLLKVTLAQPEAFAQLEACAMQLQADMLMQRVIICQARNSTYMSCMRQHQVHVLCIYHESLLIPRSLSQSKVQNEGAATPMLDDDIFAFYVVLDNSKIVDGMHGFCQL